MKLSHGFLAGALAVLFSPSWVQAQNGPSPADGFDATSRMRAFEAVFEESNAEARKRSTPALRAVMQAAFSPQADNVSAQFDKARLAILYPQGADAAATWAASLSVRPGTRLLESGAKNLPVKLAAFYDARLAVPADAVLRLSLLANGKAEDRAPMKIEKLPLETSVDLGNAKGIARCVPSRGRRQSPVQGGSNHFARVPDRGAAGDAKLGSCCLAAARH